MSSTALPIHKRLRDMRDRSIRAAVAAARAGDPDALDAIERELARLFEDRAARPVED